MFIRLHGNNAQQLVVTFKETILSNSVELMNECAINYCSAEEADPRLLRHAINQASNGLKCIVLKTVDTDVLVLAIAYCNRLMANDVNSFCVEFGVGSRTEYYNIIEIVKELGQIRSQALPFFHSFTGCDTTSSFYSHGKRSFWDSWGKCADMDRLTRAFIEVGNMPKEVTDDHVDTIQRFLIDVYYPQEIYTILTELRLRYYFKHPDPQLKGLIISRSGLENHVKRAAYQAGWLWKHCDQELICPSPVEWGGRKVDKVYTPIWCSEYKNVVEVIISCSCKETGSCVRCNCGKSNFQCIEYCNCLRKCIYSAL